MVFQSSYSAPGQFRELETPLVPCTLEYYMWLYVVSNRKWVNFQSFYCRLLAIVWRHVFFFANESLASYVVEYNLWQLFRIILCGFLTWIVIFRCRASELLYFDRVFLIRCTHAYNTFTLIFRSLECLLVSIISLGVVFMLHRRKQLF